MVRALATVALATFVGATGGFVLARSSAPELRATSWLQVGPAMSETTAVSTLVASQELADAYVELVTAPAVLTSAMERVGWSDPDTFRGRLEVTALPGTSIVAVTFRDSDGERAIRAADAVTESFVARAGSLRSKALTDAASEVDALIAARQAEIRDLNADLERRRAALAAGAAVAAPAGTEAAELASLRSLELMTDLQGQTLQRLQAARGDLRLGLATPGLRIAEKALPAGEPQVPRPVLWTLLGALAGALCAVAALIVGHWLGQHARLRPRPSLRPRRSFGIRGLAVALLWAWAALLGVQLRQDFIPNFNVAISDFLLGALLLLVLLDPSLRRRALALPRRLVWFFVAMIVALAVGCLVDAATLGFVPREGWLNKWLGLAVLAAAVGCVRAVAPTRDAIHTLLRVALLGAIWSTGIGMVFVSVGPLAALLPCEVRFCGFLTNPNAAGLYYTLGLILVFGCFGGAPLGLGRRMRVAGAVLLGIGTIATISLSSLGGWFISFFVLTIGLPRRRWSAGIVLGAVLLLTIPFANSVVAPATVQGDVYQQAALARSTAAEPSPFDAVLDAIGGPYASDAVAAKGASVFDRLALNALGLDLWSTDIWTVTFGLGLGAFPFYATASPFGLDNIIHNTYLWLLVELGIPGLVALVILLWYIAEVSVQLLRTPDRATAVTLIASIVLFMVWWQFNEGLYQRAFWLLLGAAGVLAEHARPLPSRDRAPQSVLAPRAPVPQLAAQP
jgi:hypothetical protein